MDSRLKAAREGGGVDMLTIITNTLFLKQCTYNHNFALVPKGKGVLKGEERFQESASYEFNLIMYPSKKGYKS